ncbi:MAG: retropepsin-like aspartic protease [Hyphomonadaceae bacterium]|nr:retropepsin-like aspartic protease [Hyphomonadaceae bacterium]
MTIEFTRRVMLGALPGLGLGGVAVAQSTGSRIARPTDIAAYLEAWIDTYGRPTAKVMLNGAGPFSFMVDTGSTTTVIAQRHVATLGAPIVGMATVAGTTGVAEAQVAMLERIEAGAVNKQDLRVAVLPDANIPQMDGILGADVFAAKRLVFDIQKKAVRIEGSQRSARTSSRSNMRVRNGLLAEIDGRVGAVRAKLMLDTGAERCIINTQLSEALRKAHPRLVRVDGAQLIGVTGHVVPGEHIALPEVEARAFAVDFATAVVADAPIFSLWGLDNEPALIVGVNLLSRLRSFSIDYGARTFDAILMPA